MAAAAAMKVVGDTFTSIGTFVFGGMALEMLVGGLPRNIRDYYDEKRKDSSSDLETRKPFAGAENWEKNLCENLHYFTRGKGINFSSEKVIYGNNEIYDIFLDRVRLDITLPKIKIIETTRKEKIKISKKEEKDEEENEEDEEDFKKIDKPDKEKDKENNKKEKKIEYEEIEIKEYVLSFEPEKTNGKYEELKEKKVLTEKQFNNLKPLLDEEEGVWKLKYGGKKISALLKMSKTSPDSQNLKMMISTFKSKYANWIKDFHTFLMKENIEIFENDFELFEIDIKQISKMYFLKIVCNLLGYISLAAAIVGYFFTWWIWVPWSIIMGIIGFIMTRI